MVESDGARRVLPGIDAATVSATFRVWPLATSLVICIPSVISMAGEARGTLAVKKFWSRRSTTERITESLLLWIVTVSRPVTTDVAGSRLAFIL